MKNLGTIIAILGLIFLALANIVGLGVLIYQWGSVGLALSASAWIAFKIWITMLGIGLFQFLVGIFLKEI